MTIEFSCSECGRAMRAPESAVGKKGQCPQCGAINVIPAPDAADAAETTPGVAEVTIDEAGKLVFPCPACSVPVRTPLAAAGKRGKCPHCGEIMQIPAAPTGDSESASEPEVPAPAPARAASTKPSAAGASSSGNTIQFACPHCQGTVRAPTAYAGKNGKCPQCQAVVKIPGAAPAKSPAATPATATTPKPSAPRPAATAGLTPLAAPGLSPLPADGLKPLPVPGLTPTPSPALSPLANSAAAAHDPFGPAPTAPLPAAAGLTPLAATPGLATPGLSPLGAAPGLTPIAAPGLTPLGAPGLTPLPAPAGLTPLPAPGLTPIAAPGLTPMAAPGLTPLPMPGLTPLAPAGLTPLPAPDLADPFGGLDGLGIPASNDPFATAAGPSPFTGGSTYAPPAPSRPKAAPRKFRVREVSFSRLLERTNASYTKLLGMTILVYFIGAALIGFCYGGMFIGSLLASFVGGIFGALGAFGVMMSVMGVMFSILINLIRTVVRGVRYGRIEITDLFIIDVGNASALGVFFLEVIIFGAIAVPSLWLSAYIASDFDRETGVTIYLILSSLISVGLSLMSLKFLLAPILAADRHLNPFDAIAESFNTMTFSNCIVQIGAQIAMTFVGALAIAITCGLGTLFVIPYALIAMAMFYLMATDDS